MKSNRSVVAVPVLSPISAPMISTSQRLCLVIGLVGLTSVTTTHPLPAENIKRRACVRCCLPTSYTQGRYRQVYPAPVAPKTVQSVPQSLLSDPIARTADGPKSQPVVVSFQTRNLTVQHVSLEQVAATLKADNTVYVTGELRNHGDLDKHILRNLVTVRVRGYASSDNATNPPDGPVVFDITRSFWLERGTAQPLRLICNNCPAQIKRLGYPVISHIEVEVEMRVPPNTTSRTLSTAPTTPLTP